MSDESAPITAPILPPPPPSLETAMPTPIPHRAARKRNAHPKPKPKRSPPRHRNAAPGVAPRPRAPMAPATPNTKESLVHLVETLGAAAVTSLAGAVAVRWGFHPDLVSGVLGGVGTYNAFSDKERYRYLGLGAASAAGSQLVLLKMAPKPVVRPAPPQIAVHVPAPAPPPRVKNADLGALPSGMLEAAFERARAELAVAGDGYPAHYDHAHHG